MHLPFSTPSLSPASQADGAARVGAPSPSPASSNLDAGVAPGAGAPRSAASIPGVDFEPVQHGRSRPQTVAGLDRLPAAARQRFEALSSTASDAMILAQHGSDDRREGHDRVIAAQAELRRLVNEIPASSYGRVHEQDPAARFAGDEQNERRVKRAEEDLDQAQAAFEELQVRVAEREERAAHQYGQRDELKRFLAELDPDAVITIAPEVRPVSSVAAAQRHVDELRADIHATRSAPLPSAEAKAIARAEVERQADEGRPNLLGCVERGSRPGWRGEMLEGRAGGGLGVMVAAKNAVALLAWLDRDALIVALEREIDELADDDAALSERDRAARLGDLGDRLLEAQRVEVATIDQERGDFMYRTGTDAYVILGIVVEEEGR